MNQLVGVQQKKVSKDLEDFLIKDLLGSWVNKVADWRPLRTTLNRFSVDSLVQTNKIRKKVKGMSSVFAEQV